MIDYAGAAELLERYGRAWQTFDGDAWVALFSEDAEYHGDPFGAPLVGHNALRAFLLSSADTQRDVEFTVERHWVSGNTVLAAWHAAWNGRANGKITRVAGFLTAEIAPDDRISRFREWAQVAPDSAG
ncbi:MAG TPA: nuclear transport factor 2 family protein [Candidatus Limnocylindrales bacterium]|jgi:ketosteroid isomerase-like protein|nr:nuclear transport factor 2 family protein [Candidatus Limnocylindrales bacterium]